MKVQWALLAIAVVACGCGKSVECGNGTLEQNGTCVAAMSNTSTNGTTGTTTGTTNTTGADLIECGTGTTLDAQNRCVVSDPVTCGAGTQLDANGGGCVPTDEVCGPRTAFDAASGTCRPTGAVCDAGTSFDSAAGLCMSDVECSPGDVVVGGFCVTAAEKLRRSADLTEAENNDPARGGLADTFALLPAGDTLVLAGSTAVPTDLDQDSVADVDFDVFEFDATAGQWITVTLQPLGGPPIAFEVTNDSGYLRQAIGSDAYGAAREFVIREDGTYRLTIAPQAAWLFPGSTAGDGAQWVATVELSATPTAMTVDFESGLNGTLASPRDNFYRQVIGLGDGFIFDLESAAEVELIAFDGGAMIGFSDSGALPITVPTGNLTVVADHVSGDPTASYQLMAASAVSLGTLAPPATLSATLPDLVTDVTVAMTVPSGFVPVVQQTNDQQVDVTVEMSINGVTINSSLSDTSTMANATSYAPAGFAGGLLRIKVAGTATNVQLNISAQAVSDEGAVTPPTQLDTTSTTALDQGAAEFFVFDLTAPARLVGTFSDFVSLTVFDAQSAPVPSSSFITYDAELVPGSYLVMVTAFAPTSGWTFSGDFTVP